MKLTVNQNEAITESEVIINCGRIDGHIRGMIDTIRQYTRTLSGELDGSIHQVPLETVIYIDSVEKRTFFYDRFRIFRTEKSLSALEALLKDAHFLRVSKNCIINLALVQRVLPYGDRKLRVVMLGGECLEVGRAYRNALLERLRQTEITPERGTVSSVPGSGSNKIDCTERAVRNAGNVLTFHGLPQRVVALSYGAAEIICALGREDTLTAIAMAEDLPSHTSFRYRSTLERIPTLRHCGDGVPTIEELRSLEPDLVICNWYYPRMIGEFISESSFPFYVTESTIPEKARLEQMYQDILKLGRIFRAEDRAIALVEQTRQRITVLTRRLFKRKPVRVFVYDGQQYRPYTTGRGTLEHDLISIANGENVFGHLEGSYQAVSWSEVAEQAPEIIILHDYQDSMTTKEKIACLKCQPELRNVPAVCQDRFVSLTLTEVFPGIQCAKAVEKLVRAFHPDTL